MSDKLQVITRTFNDKPITTLVYQGRPCWIAREVAIAIGYADPRSFISRITGEWASEMHEEKHFSVIFGKDLKALRNVVTSGVTSGVMSQDILPARAPSVLVLFEAGMHMALLKTDKPRGTELRKVLSDEVLPQLARDGRYLPEREVTPQGVMVESEYAKRMRELDVEERRLALDWAEFEARERDRKSKALLLLRDLHGGLDESQRAMLAVKAAEEASGRDLTLMLPPPAPESLSWESPTQIGKRLGVSANAVGKAITALGLRGAEGLSREIVNKAQHSDRTVVSYLYSPEAVERIAEHLHR